MCCTRLSGNAEPKKSPSGHHHTTLLGYIFTTKACIENRKYLLNSNMSPACSHNMVNFGPLTAKIRSRVWGTAANFNRFSVLAVSLHGTSSGREPNFAVLNRGRYLYSAGRPSRWALAHILVVTVIPFDGVKLTWRKHNTPAVCSSQ